MVSLTFLSAYSQLDGIVQELDTQESIISNSSSNSKICLVNSCSDKGKC